MVTKHEQRVLYLVRKHGGRCLASKVAQGMARVPIKDRERAITNCETLELLSSARTPATRGRGGLMLWLTSEGTDYVQGLIDSGDMLDPLLEPRAGKGAAHASG